MNNTTDFTVKFLDNCMNFPVIPFYFQDKENRTFECYMLIDTGSHNNIIFGAMKDLLPEECFQKGETTKIKTLFRTFDNTNAKMSFILQNRQFTEDFSLCETNHLNVGTRIVVGILGICFLLKHGLTLDYSNLMLHNFKSNEEEILANTDYTLDMNMGLTTYGLPILVILKGQNAILALADSGANMNSITRKALSDLNCEYKMLENKRTLSAFNIFKVVDNIEMSYTLCYSSDMKKSVDYKDIFSVVDIDHFLSIIEEVGKKVLIPNTNEEIPPIEANIGSDFMSREGWILDFKKWGIFKPKDKNEFNSNVFHLA